MKYDFYCEKKKARPQLGRALRHKFYGKLMRRVSKGDTLLISSVFEIGAGWGDFADFCQQKRITYLGIEPHPELVGDARERGLNIVWGNADNQDRLMPGRMFNVVFISHVLEHLKGEDDILILLEELQKRLMPEGLLVILYPDISLSHWQFFDEDYTHKFPTSPRRMRNLLYDAGYEIIDQGHYFLSQTRGARLLCRLIRLATLPLYPLTDYFERTFIPSVFTIARRRK